MGACSWRITKRRCAYWRWCWATYGWRRPTARAGQGSRATWPSSTCCCTRATAARPSTPRPATCSPPKVVHPSTASHCSLLLCQRSSHNAVISIIPCWVTSPVLERSHARYPICAHRHGSSHDELGINNWCLTWITSRQAPGQYVHR